MSNVFNNTSKKNKIAYTYNKSQYTVLLNFDQNQTQFLNKFFQKSLFDRKTSYERKKKKNLGENEISESKFISVMKDFFEFNYDNEI